MIASLSGIVSLVEEDSVVVEVGGVGIKVNAPSHWCARMKRGEPLTLHTHLVVREDSLSLFGFETIEEREFFQVLLGVNGVGPRLALGIISALEPESIRRAVFNDQPEVFNRVPGVGKKSAQKILFHLKDRLPIGEGLEPVVVMSEIDQDVLDALVSLGYSLVEAQSAIQSIPRDAPADIEERLRLALSHFR